MLSIDFSSLQKKHPDLREPLQMLANWLKDHDGVRVLEPVELARAFRGKMKPEELNDALGLLIKEAGFEQVYRVLDPAKRTYAPGSWPTPIDIPDRVPSRTHQMIDKSEAEILPVLQPAG